VAIRDEPVMLTPRAGLAHAHAADVRVLVRCHATVNTERLPALGDESSGILVESRPERLASYHPGHEKSVRLERLPRRHSVDDLAVHHLALMHILDVHNGSSPCDR